MKLPAVSVFLFLLLTSLIACTQTPEPRPAALNHALDDASISIKQERSGIPNSVLQEDKRAIREAAPAMEDMYKLQSAGKATDALVGRWKSLRTGPYAIPESQPVGVDRFIRYGFAVENANGEISDQDYLRVYSHLIQTKAPSVKASVLEQDQTTVLQSLPALRKQYRDQGYSVAEANDAATWSWKSLRSGPNAIDPTQPLPVQVFMNYGNQIGRLSIESDPTGALVSVDGEKWPDPTNTSMYAQAGRRVIVLSMPQYETLREEFVIQAEKRNQFKRALKKSQ